MKYEIAIPKLGLTMEEATLLQWHHEDGQRVAKGDTVITIETDKIVFDVRPSRKGFCNGSPQRMRVCLWVPWPAICMPRQKAPRRLAVARQAPRTRPITRRSLRFPNLRQWPPQVPPSKPHTLRC